MSNDLISRKDVFKAMEHIFNNYCNNAGNFGEEETKAIDKAFTWLQKCISDIPTTYDVDRVISNIWDRSELIHIKHNCYDEVEDYIRVTDVSEIVKTGGIDE